MTDGPEQVSQRFAFLYANSWLHTVSHRRSLLQNVFLSFLYLSVPFFSFLTETYNFSFLFAYCTLCLPYWGYCDIGSQPLRWYQYHWEIKLTLSVSSCSCCLALYRTSQCWVQECWWSWCCWWCCSAESWRSPPRPEDTQVSPHSRETRVGCARTKPRKRMSQGSEMFDGGQNSSSFKL